MADHILTQDPTKPGVIKGNGPILASGNKIPLSGLDGTGAANGDVVTFNGTNWVPGTGGASSDTASNLGAGSQVFKSKVGADFQFRSLVAGSNITVTQNANDITIASTASSGVFTRSFTSAPQAITPNGSLTIAHLMTVKPELVQGYILCTSADLGWTAGDEIVISPLANDSGSGYGFAVERDVTNLLVKYPNSNCFGVPHFVTGTLSTITAANWSLILKCWA